MTVTQAVCVTAVAALAAVTLLTRIVRQLQERPPAPPRDPGRHPVAQLERLIWGEDTSDPVEALIRMRIRRGETREQATALLRKCGYIE